jgi:hypothetical protein
MFTEILNHFSKLTTHPGTPAGIALEQLETLAPTALLYLQGKQVCRDPDEQEDEFTGTAQPCPDWSISLCLAIQQVS